MSHPDPHNDPENTYPVRKFGTGKLERPVKKMLAITPNSGIGAKSKYGSVLHGRTAEQLARYKSDSSKTKALKGKAGELHKRASEGSFARMNKERKAQGFKPKTDRATKGLYDFLDN